MVIISVCKKDSETQFTNTNIFGCNVQLTASKVLVLIVCIVLKIEDA